MTDFEAPETDAQEQDRRVYERGDAGVEEVPVEAPEADTVEQHTPAVGGVGEPEHPAVAEADEADRAEQDRTVEFDEEEYR